MKKSYILTIGSIFIISMILTACGKTGKSSVADLPKPVIVNVHPASLQVSGDLGGYFEVAGRDFVIIDHLLTVEVRRTMKDFTFSTANLHAYGDPVKNGAGFYGFGITLMGNAGPGETISATSTGTPGPFNYTDATGLMNLKKGESLFIRWKVANPENIKTFRLTSALSLGK